MTLVYIGIVACAILAVWEAVAGHSIEAAIYTTGVLIALTRAEISR